MPTDEQRQIVFPDEQYSRHIKWPTSLNSLSFDEPGQKATPTERLGKPFGFPTTEFHTKSNSPTQKPMSHINSTIINVNQSNDSDITIANILTNVIDIVENSNRTLQMNGSNNLTNITSGLSPYLHIDDNGIFQIKYNRSEFIAPSINGVAEIPTNISSFGNDRNTNIIEPMSDHNQTDNNQMYDYDFDVRYDKTDGENSESTTNKIEIENEFLIIIDGENWNATTFD